MSNEKYYVPHGTYWPIIGSIGISTLFIGFANQMHDVSWGWPVMVLGFAIIAFMMFGWLCTVVAESVGGMYNSQVDRSFRWGMSWFIFSEVMFFAGFFGLFKRDWPDESKAWHLRESKARLTVSPGLTTESLGKTAQKLLLPKTEP